MSAVDFIVLGVVAALLALAINKIVKDKKKGVKCSGCSEGCACSESSKSSKSSKSSESCECPHK